MGSHGAIMRKLITIGCLLMVGVGAMALPPMAFMDQLKVAKSGGGGQDLTVGLAHFWNPADTLSADDQAGSLDATLAGGLTNSVNGWEMGTANTDYAYASGAIANGTNYSISVWIEPDVVAMELNASGGWIGSERIGVSGAKQDWVLGYITARNTYEMIVWDSAGSVEFGAITNDTSSTDWRHIVAVVDSDNGEIRMYNNGQLSSTTALTIVPNDAFDSLTGLGSVTGGGLGGDPRFKYHGVMDKFRFYTNAIDDAFALAIYDDEKASKGL
jgi:hypothetical protein